MRLPQMKIRTMKNLKKIQINGCSYQCSKVIEKYRLSKDGTKVIDYNLIGFVDEKDQEIIWVGNVEAVLWVDNSDPKKQQYWIETSAYAEDFFLEEPISFKDYMKSVA
ncbi:hypothetical protein DU472_04425 [Campylobacter novaezeelandiae]|uniref:hypothetical protein n=1 Tax=Campylobacter novaezeelandiae TaxID=2267891 RepID=UPI001037D1E7|nr:hypothetical protein [Campylobacter novaezeelandiae]TBR80910.1 hypothetical protein DU472_04425 [Campylobacter novaezeelandiae]